MQNYDKSTQTIIVSPDKTYAVITDKLIICHVKYKFIY